MKEWKFIIRIVYDDNTEFTFDVSIWGTKLGVMANLMMITRGTLNASSAEKAYCYNSDGNLEIAYRR